MSKREPRWNEGPHTADLRDALQVAPGELDPFGHYASRRLEDGTWIALEPMTFGQVRLVRTFDKGATMEEALADPLGGYRDTWEYRRMADARAAFDTWDGTSDPGGWRRHPNTARRRQRSGACLVRVSDLGEDGVALIRKLYGGKPHDCNEWRTERGVRDTGRCLLCDRVLVALPVSIDTVAISLGDLEEAGGPLEDPSARAAIEALQAGARAGAELLAAVRQFADAGLELTIGVAGEPDAETEADVVLGPYNAAGFPSVARVTARGLARLQAAVGWREKGGPDVPTA